MLSTGIASNAAIDWLGSSSRENRLLVSSQERSNMLDPQKTLEREALLKRIRELDAKLPGHRPLGRLHRRIAARHRHLTRRSPPGVSAQPLSLG